MKSLRTFTYFFAIQFLSYGLVCWNFRAIANGWLVNVAASDLLIALLGFVIIKEVAKATGAPAILGYVSGGTCGSISAILVTRVFFGH